MVDPDLITLRINSLKLHRSIINEGFSTTCSIEYASTIKKVYMEKMQTIQEIYFLLNIFPHMEFLNVDPCRQNGHFHFRRKLISPKKSFRGQKTDHLISEQFFR